MQYMIDFTNKYLKNITNNSCWIVVLLLVLLLFGCESVDEVMSEEEGIVDVPIALSVGGGWTVGLGDGPTRSEAYDEDELAGVKEAQIFVFRRPEGSADDVPFRYDPTNFMIVPLTTDLTGENGGKLNGEATLHKRPGFEYRVMAVSYSSDRKTGYEDAVYGSASHGLVFSHFTTDLQRFFIPVEPEMSLEEFKAKVVLYTLKHEDGYWTDLIDGGLGAVTTIDEDRVHVNALSGIVADYPRLFYCDCYVEYNGEIRIVIPYSCGNDSFNGTEVGGQTDIEVKGELRIGMSKLVIKINKFTNHHFVYNYSDSYYPVDWLTLMSDNVAEDFGLTELGEKWYDDEVSFFEKYTPICYRSCEFATSISMTAYLPPMLTHLAMRVKCSKMVQYELRVYLDNYLIRPEDDVVIDPETGEEIRNTYNDVFYLRPNHKYVIEVEDSEELLKYPIR